MSYKQAAQLRRKIDYDKQLIDQFVTLWSGNDCTKDAPVGANFEKSITTWGYFGVNAEDFEEFISSIEFRSDLDNDVKWRYFCKCAWNVVKINREIAEGGYEIEP